MSVSLNTEHLHNNDHDQSSNLASYILDILDFAIFISVYSYIVVSARAHIFFTGGATRKYISIAYTLMDSVLQTSVVCSG